MKPLRDAVGVPLIVVSTLDDNLAAINTVLREAGHAVHCRRVDEAAALREAIDEHQPELVLLFGDEPGLDLSGLSSTVFRRNPPLPVIIVRQQVTERIMSEAISAGARDVVSLQHRIRLQAVVERELRTRRLQATLNGVLSSASQYKQELRSLMQGATEAMADVQEGIVIAVNPAWLSLFGKTADEEDELLGQPFMDQFDVKDLPSLKGAMKACLRGKWNDASLEVNARRDDGSSLLLDLQLASVSVEGEPAIRVTVPAGETEAATDEQQLEQALSKDPSTGFLLRHHFLEQLQARLQSPPKAGIRALAYFRPDNFSRVHSDVGLLGTEALIMRLAEQLRELLQPGDICGRFGGTIFALLLERGTMTDVEAWAEQVRKAIASRVFEVDSQSTSLTCTIGLTEVDSDGTSIAELLATAEQACRAGRDSGGNRVELCESTSASRRLRVQDATWIPRIRSALMQNRFRLLHQPIASLSEEVQGMFDTLIRMVDESGETILPGEFMPPAKRAGLVKNVDRWVIGATLSFCATRQPSLVFVRLSRDSVLDDGLMDWLQARLRDMKVQPERLCFQVSEEVASAHLKQTRDLSTKLADAGMNFAIDHVGTGRDSAQLLQHVPMQYMKIDGSLMQGLNRDTDQQQRVAQLAQIAKKLDIRTVAERVEDAKTMAVLWQLGIAYFQGNFLQTHGVVLESDPDQHQQLSTG